LTDFSHQKQRDTVQSVSEHSQ